MKNIKKNKLHDAYSWKKIFSGEIISPIESLHYFSNNAINYTIGKLKQIKTTQFNVFYNLEQFLIWLSRKI